MGLYFREEVLARLIFPEYSGPGVNALYEFEAKRTLTRRKDEKALSSKE